MKGADPPVTVPNVMAPLLSPQLALAGVVTMADEGAVTVSASTLGLWKKTGTGSAVRAFYLFGQRATVA